MTTLLTAVLALSLPLSAALFLPLSLSAADTSSPQQTRSPDFRGTAQVTDGDTLRMSGHTIRIHGIAAPERDEPGGSDATRYMKALVEGREVTCTDTGERTHARIVATCKLRDGRDVGAAMVEGGHARDCARHSGGRYASAEKRARSNGKDLSKTYRLPGYCVR